MNGRQVRSIILLTILPAHIIRERQTYMLTLLETTDQTRCGQRPEHRAGELPATRYEAYRIRTRGRRGLECCQSAEIDSFCKKVFAIGRIIT